MTAPANLTHRGSQATVLDFIVSLICAVCITFLVLSIATALGANITDPAIPTPITNLVHGGWSWLIAAGTGGGALLLGRLRGTSGPGATWYIAVSAGMCVFLVGGGAAVKFSLPILPDHQEVALWHVQVVVKSANGDALDSIAAATQTTFLIRPPYPSASTMVGRYDLTEVPIPVSSKRTYLEIKPDARFLAQEIPLDTTSVSDTTKGRYPKHYRVRIVPGEDHMIEITPEVRLVLASDSARAVLTALRPTNPAIIPADSATK